MLESNSQLEQIANLLGNKFSTRLRFNSTTSEFTTSFSTPIQLDSKLNYEIGLLSFATFNIVHNITETNNKFKVGSIVHQGKGMGFEGTLFEITPGAYELDKELFARMQKMIFDKYQVDGVDAEGKKIKVSPIQLKVDRPTARVKLTIKKPYILQFACNKERNPSGCVETLTSDLGKFLGFEKDSYSEDSTGEKTPNISDITTVNVMCDIVKGSYQDGSRDQCVYDFPYGSVPHGYRIIQVANPPVYVPIMSRSAIYDITIKIVDQKGKLIDFNGEAISITLILKQV